jgi:hypothetical protein
MSLEENDRATASWNRAPFAAWGEEPQPVESETTRPRRSSSGTLGASHRTISSLACSRRSLPRPTRPGAATGSLAAVRTTASRSPRHPARLGWRRAFLSPVARTSPGQSIHKHCM